ncbi:hypothetical protein I1S38_20135 [Serratia ureilytica]|uniref:hypothetical protein n=1 Tax=Serratia ureilytica TaxID=300181 RepID=UPI0018A6FA78|nr:hypothetical protein [Serratia ureilytica]MBF4187968.1 hypothetical protein [Serratia ureilytica]MBF8442080.1 hypothetical protein [Serratia ureilytica]MBF8446225.1 hypothetical protein [Serratia ureilytica]
MHHAQECIKAKFNLNVGNLDSISSCVLTGPMAAELDKCLKSDAVNYLYSSLISYAEAVKGIESGLFSWATVKLYYCAFYSLRSILSIDGFCVFYVGTKGYSVKARQGEFPVKAAGTTHKLVMSLFKRHNSSSPFVTQEIDMIEPFEWLISKREQANYKNGRFTEPEIPVIFNKSSFGLQVLMKEYILDKEHKYCFDSDHAVLALPLEIIKEASVKLLSSTNFRLNQNDVKYLKGLLRVSGKPVVEFQGLIDTLR